MVEDTDKFIQHADAVLSMARRLAPLGVAIYKHEYNPSGFGSWIIVAGTHQRRLQFTWEEREFKFSLARATVGEARQSLGWQPFRNINLRYEQAIAEMERVLHETFALTKMS